jgi:excinuclease ABC subunit B
VALVSVVIFCSHGVHDRFNLVTDFELRGDQSRAIDELVEGLNRGDKSQVLLGVTGSGKTFTMAQSIARVNRPTLVMAHNKTLAAQPPGIQAVLPRQRRRAFVSYYDYTRSLRADHRLVYREGSDDQRRDRPDAAVATWSLFERRDVIIVASVSCIYGLARRRRTTG